MIVDPPSVLVAVAPRGNDGVRPGAWPIAASFGAAARGAQGSVGLGATPLAAASTQPRGSREITVV